MKTKRPFWILNTAFVAISFVGAAQAAIVEFDLSPVNTSAGVGLSPANVSSTTVSTGSGNEISGGISLNSDTNVLSISFGYGSAAGFSDLTGATTTVHLHGPAAAGATGPMISDFAPLTFNASPSTKGGVVTGAIALTDAQEANLLANLNYVDVHTAANSAGEIRGQLVRVNVAPVVTCEQQLTVECGTSFTFNANVADFDGDAVSVKFTLNGEDVKTVALAAGSPPAGQTVSLTTDVHNEVNLLTITATDSKGEITICDVIINAQDTVAPSITALSVTPKVLWPPNHKLVPITVDAVVQDACGDTSYKIISITSSQPEGKGKHAPDTFITGDRTGKVRAERLGNIKEARVYTIAVQATDEAGNKSAVQNVTVTVPHDQGKGKVK